ncbi:Rhomboid-related protein 4 [Armadillidium vulgare]|nr:Rhomboid-related protein 4 [Armadillidium vulgare]
MPRRRQPLMSYGIFLLAHDLFQTGFQHIPPITLVAVLAQAALFIGIINPPWEGYEVCLSGESILYYKDYRRLILSAIEHADDLHLYHNMVSLILKGRTLESRYGSLKFSVILLVFMISTSGMYLALSKALYMYFDDYSYMKQCAIGFSGVLFALKVLTTFEGGGTHWIHGFEVPSRLVEFLLAFFTCLGPYGLLLMLYATFYGEDFSTFVDLVTIVAILMIVERARLIGVQVIDKRPTDGIVICMRSLMKMSFGGGDCIGLADWTGPQTRISVIFLFTFIYSHFIYLK